MTTPTREQAMQWAQDAGVMIGTDEEWSVPVSLYIRDRLYVLAALAYAAGAAAEREACAKLCDELNHADNGPAYRYAARWCADAIRARGKE